MRIRYFTGSSRDVSQQACRNRPRGFYTPCERRPPGAPRAKEPSMPALPELHTLLTGLAFGESPRWHDDRLWFSDMGAGEIVAADLDGDRQVISRLPALPMGTGWLPD